MEKTHIRFLQLALLLTALFIILPVTSATIAQVTPVTYSNQSTTITTNWTFVNGTDGIQNILNANSTFYWNGSGSWVAISKSAFTCSVSDCQATLTMTGLTEGIGALNFTAGNVTAVLGGTRGSNIRLDLTSPTVSISFSPTQFFKSQPTTLIWSTSDAGAGLQTQTMTVVSSSTTACPTITSTATSGNQILTPSQTSCVGTYTGTLTSTDFAGNTGTATGTFTTTDVGTVTYVPSQSSSNAGTNAGAQAIQNINSPKGRLSALVNNFINFFRHLFGRS